MPCRKNWPERADLQIVSRIRNMTISLPRMTVDLLSSRAYLYHVGRSLFCSSGLKKKLCGIMHVCTDESDRNASKTSEENDATDHSQ